MVELQRTNLHLNSELQGLQTDIAAAKEKELEAEEQLQDLHAQVLSSSFMASAASCGALLPVSPHAIA